MCFATPNMKPPPPVAPPPPPEPSATEIATPGAKKKRGSGSGLDSLRIPLNPTGQPQQPRLGL